MPSIVGLNLASHYPTMADPAVPPNMHIDAKVGADGRFKYSMAALNDRLPTNVSIAHVCLVFDSDPPPDTDVGHWGIHFQSVLAADLASTTFGGSYVVIPNSPTHVRAVPGAPRTWKYYDFRIPMKLALDNHSLVSGTHVGEGRILVTDNDTTTTPASSNGIETYNVLVTEQLGARVIPDRIIIQLQISAPPLA